MALRKISQREAHRLRREVEQFQDMERKRNAAWSSEYPGGTNIVQVPVGDLERAHIQTALTLGHHIIGKLSNGKLLLFAWKP